MTHLERLIGAGMDPERIQRHGSRVEKGGSREMTNPKPSDMLVAVSMKMTTMFVPGTWAPRSHTNTGHE